jgi:subfamily B ATP-binding cassette protein MsbA
MKTTWLDYLRQGLSRQLPPDRLAAQNATRGDLRSVLLAGRFRPFVQRHWRKGAVGMGLVIFSSLMAFPMPMLTAFMIDKVMLGKRLDLLVYGLAGIAAINVINWVTSNVQRYYMTRYEAEIILDIQQDLLERTLHFPKSFFDDKEVGYLMSRVASDVNGLRWFFSSVLVNIITNMIRLVGGAIMLVYLEWRLSVVALVIIPALIFWARFFSRRSRALSHHSMERQANVSKRMQESLSSTTLIKAFASEEREVGRVMDEMRSAYHLSLEQLAVGSFASTLLSMLDTFVNFIVFAVGAFWVIQGQMTLGNLMAFRSYMGYVYGPAQFLANVNIQLQNALASLERVSSLYDIVPEESGVGLPVERLSGEVDFRSVTFSYDEQHPVLKDLSVHVKPGEHIAIVGPSGVGKTTLVSLLLRLYRPTSGEIWFDGRPATDYELSCLRQRIGYVSQSNLLLTGTVLENLRYGDPNASLEQVIKAAQVAGIHDFITHLPEGYNAPVGERGVNFSEGQKQRMAIARALVKNPDILILDEPTASLDSLTEKSIFEALPDLVRDKTLFVVAHRLSTVQDSDRILLLNENRLVDIGTHKELFEKDEFYRSMVLSQQLVA